MTGWLAAQGWERAWWGDCANTYGEETKQLAYAEKMGLRKIATPKKAENFDLAGASILDIGSGPTSLLLKCLNRGRCYVLDPLMDRWPPWVRLRYEQCGIEVLAMRAEDLGDEPQVDEAWLYNVLEHTEDPLAVIRNAQRLAKLIRLFEWVDIAPSPGHPHALAEEQLNDWLRGEGRVQMFARGRTRGRGYYGIFV